MSLKSIVKHNKIYKNKLLRLNKYLFKVVNNNNNNNNKNHREHNLLNHMCKNQTSCLQKHFKVIYFILF